MALRLFCAWGLLGANFTAISKWVRESSIFFLNSPFAKANMYGPFQGLAIGCEVDVISLYEFKQKKPPVGESRTGGFEKIDET